ncbi:heat shock 70 kDa protein 12A-like [Mya arenaria]|uniref:heat shock 70 kDa protein 12A-like n=1 Tax=Mya arenaria TaxID=6604 RepID=UPI0022E3F5D9|nr:heat shock 70 kDa protein 12A-like [Mya arenaria]
MLLVAAFDFGTTYSGYAFSFRDDPNKIQTNQSWYAGGGASRLVSLKTPTSVLLTPEGEFDKFGFEAEDKYATLAEDNEHHGWRLFRRFKMVLHNNTHLTKDVTVEDFCGKRMTAFPLFVMSIKYLRDHLLKAVTTQKIGIEETDISYVLTVPGIWDDNAKRFMRDAAVAAAIDPARLKLALEPECASIWCETLGTDVRGAVAIAGSQYMVVDLGVCLSVSLRDLADKHFKHSVEERIAAMDIQENSITPKGKDKLKIVGTLIQSWFKGSIDLLIQHIKSLLAEAKMEHVHTIILVGGFGESPFVQERMRNKIAGVTLIVPQEAGLAVLRGAVRFGHNPSIVSSRIMKYTYGLRGYDTFDEKKHANEKKIWMNERWVVSECFIVFVRVNEEVRIDQQQTKTSIPTRETSHISVYRTTHENPVYATDLGCELLGTVELENSTDIPFQQQITETLFMLGDTELLVKLRNTATGKEAYMLFECFK